MSTTPDPTQGQPEPPGGMPPQPGPPPPGAPAAQPGTPGQPPQANPYARPDDSARPGSRAWVDARYGRTTEFADRIVPRIVDNAVGFLPPFLLFLVGFGLFVAGLPETRPCSYAYYDDCEIPGSGNGALVGLGILLWFLAFVLSFAVWFWNRVWRVTKTGQSIGRKMSGLKVVNAEEGRLPRLGEMVLRELVTSVAGIIDIVWMLVDDQRRTLGDIVGKTAVVHDKGA